MKPIVIKFLVVVAMLYASVSNAATDEFVAEIIDLDIKTSEVTIIYMHMREMDFRLAYDVRIRIANGEKGAVANLRKGNQITAVGDPDKKIIYALKILN